MNKRIWLVAFLAFVLVLSCGLAAIITACGDATVSNQTDTTAAAAVQELDDGIGILGLAAGPLFWPGRNNTGFVLFVDGAQYMVDIGGGTPQELVEMGQGLAPLQNLFITHLHFDHTAGLAEMLARGYQTYEPSPLSKLDIWGPPGVERMVGSIMDAWQAGFQLHNWQGQPGTPWLIPTAHDIDLPTWGVEVVYEDRHVKVSATRVDHDYDVANAYAYRFDILAGPAAGKSVVFSGDRNDDNQGKNRTPEDNEKFRAQFRELAQGATILVHEVSKSDWADKIADPNSGEPFQVALYDHLVNSHTEPMVVVALAKELGVEVLVANHYGNIGTEYSSQEARDIIYEDLTKANEEIGFEGEIIAPMEGDFISL